MLLLFIVVVLFIATIFDKDKIVDNIDNKMLLSFLFQYISLEERNILMLHVISGFKFKEIAKILDLSLSTVLSKYHRAIKKIKIENNEKVECDVYGNPIENR